MSDKRIELNDLAHAEGSTSKCKYSFIKFPSYKNKKRP